MTIKLHDPHVRYTAEEYDRFTATVIRPFDEAFAPVVAQQTRKRGPGAVLLDVGTGTARFLIHLAQAGLADDVRLVGTDLFDDMLDQARRAAAAAGVAIDLRREDVHAMTLPDAFADVVVSRSTVHHWSDPAQAFREIDRVLKPGGVAFIVDVRRDAPAEAVAAFNALRRDAGLPPSVLDEKYTVAELRGFCTEAGLDGRCEYYTAEDGIAALGVTIVIRSA
jgi:ubiquinone/menaquinone biosynthesis C-methylase UbiE